MLHRLIYCSRNRIAGSPQEITSAIEAILRRSRLINKSKDVTGALLFNGEAFAQVLEGSRAAVQAIYANILKDSRHSHVVLLEDVPIGVRDFTNWSMAFSGADKGVSLYAGLRFEACEINPPGIAHQVLALLKAIVGAHA
jgi:hypothetical protein